ncbi:MAG: hypothetical protein KF799_02820 [Bdellovibrionales bacterium]|nr:hypothetical protein [Bdellovibrionales bacterium]
MESLNPPLLSAVQDLRRRISAGISMKEAFESYLNSHADELAADWRERWTLKWQAGKSSTVVFKTHYRRALWELVERGCGGQPVLESLTALEEEIESAAQAELDRHLSTLPFKVMLPLLFLQFPAHLILLLGPMLRELTASFGG